MNSGQRVLVTRPREDSADLAQLLRSQGFTVTVEPLLTVRSLAATVDLAGVQAILCTSANGVRKLAEVSPDRALPLFAVGEATARTARALGFVRVESADGDVAALAELVRGRLRPGNGALLHAAGSVTAGDLGGELARAGFEVRKVQLYEAITAEALSGTMAAGLERGAFDGVLFYSPRTAATFRTLVERAA
ncbi:MAG: uroporphyrinogen-III synthase, partial [Alphaproteobacteria bacterium]